MCCKLHIFRDAGPDLAGGRPGAFMRRGELLRGNISKDLKKMIIKA